MSAVEKAKLLSLQQKKMIEGCRKIFLDDMPAFLIKGNGIAIRAGGFLVRYTLDSRKKNPQPKRGLKVNRSQEKILGHKLLRPCLALEFF